METRIYVFTASEDHAQRFGYASPQSMITRAFRAVKAKIKAFGYGEEVTLFKCEYGNQLNDTSEHENGIVMITSPEVFEQVEPFFKCEDLFEMCGLLNAEDVEKGWFFFWECEVIPEGNDDLVAIGPYLKYVIPKGKAQRKPLLVVELSYEESSLAIEGKRNLEARGFKFKK